MAKKGGVQQLQADINTDEEFEKFLERPGLLVLDVYSEWCGPCLGMVGSLKKIKLELGGDNLHLAICKSDTISHLKRFNKKSEPTWLFITKGRAVNLMFGTNVPKLIRTIATELEMLTSQEPRESYGITELHPEEQERQKVKDEAKAEAEKIESIEREKKRRDYLISVTDIIMENLPDIGITIFGPQVNRDMFKKIMEPADVLKTQCKDRRVVPVAKEHFEIINFDSTNPLDDDVIEQFDKKELLICFWKVPDEQSAPEVLNTLANELMRPRRDSTTNGGECENPPIISPLEMEVTFELPVSQQSSDKSDQRIPSGTEALTEYDEFDEKLNQVDVEKPLPEAEELQLEVNSESEQKDEQLSEDKDGEEMDEEIPPKRLGTKIVCIPPIWVPNDQRTHAALIYVYFRPQTLTFLPPDPEPEPPHIVMAFDAYKKKDLVDLAERLKEDVPLYGFFNNDIPGEAKFIANCVVKYSQHPHLPTDKLVFKVNKTTSDAMLAFAVYGPSFVSANTVIGREEAFKFFPVGYKTHEQEILEAEKSAAQLYKKKRKLKKGAQAEAEADAPQTPSAATAGTEEANLQGTEEGVTSSGEDSGDSDDDDDDGNGGEQPTESNPT